MEILNWFTLRHGTIRIEVSEEKQKTCTHKYRNNKTAFVSDGAIMFGPEHACRLCGLVDSSDCF